MFMLYRPFASVRSALGLASKILTVAALAAFVPSAASAEQGGFRCETLSFPVTVSASDPTVYNVVGDLCSRGSIHDRTIQVTVSGATYGHVYWDFPYQPENYSYVRRATAEGYAVLNLDRIGVGRSDHPPADQITLEADAWVTHQVIQALRSGTIVAPSFGRVEAEKVVLIGHSLGSSVAILEAAYYGDVDGVVLTGLTHTFGPGLALAFAAFYPASLDPVLGGAGLTDGYLTTIPGHREIFYNPPYDPQVAAIDEATKQTVTTGELGNPFVWMEPSKDIHVPVLVLMGDNDSLFCGVPTCTESGTFETERSFFAPDACLETVAIANAGHDLNLQFQAQESYGVITDWIDRRVGRDAHSPAAEPCLP
jgi:pimeloyl-ACP methyl ester carboxylesterase